jgi:lipoprotein NlpD
LLFIVLLFDGCAAKKVHYVPVADASKIDPIPKDGIHRVQKGETLHSIAWRYGLDFRKLAQRNHLLRPYHVLAGQTLYLKDRSANIKKVAVLKPKILSTSSLHPIIRPSVPHVSKKSYLQMKVVHWHWPAKGRVLGGFSDFNKGINISGHYGDPVYTTAPGRVVYCGNGLRGYGNLIIIEHNNTYLSAYAHNSALLVKEGQWVKSGQRIAKMGDSGSRQVMLHFEIRREGKSVNPLAYLNV